MRQAVVQLRMDCGGGREGGRTPLEFWGLAPVGQTPSSPSQMVCLPAIPALHIRVRHRFSEVQLVSTHLPPTVMAAPGSFRGSSPALNGQIVAVGLSRRPSARRSSCSACWVFAGWQLLPPPAP